jgi:hypothetical protein
VARAGLIQNSKVALLVVLYLYRRPRPGSLRSKVRQTDEELHLVQSSFVILVGREDI